MKALNGLIRQYVAIAMNPKKAEENSPKIKTIVHFNSAKQAAEFYLLQFGGLTERQTKEVLQELENKFGKFDS
ncbi:MAG: hypothetical protein WCF92_02230 [bacterium]